MREILEIGFLAAVLAIVGISIAGATTQDDSLLIQNIDEATADLEDPEPVDEIISQFKLSGDGYHQLFEELALPNTLNPLNSPEITVSKEADTRILELAEKRGYRLRRVAVEESQLVDVGSGKFLQEAAAVAWNGLSKQAEEDNIRIEINSAYRNVDTQRELFNTRLTNAGATPVSIASGSVDNLVNNVLATTAPPGYSRHHNGYTIDFKGSDSLTFANTAAYKWLSANNFEIAKQFGFIPSYPDDAADQGPNPESWEFVWVGQDVIAEQVEPDA